MSKAGTLPSMPDAPTQPRVPIPTIANPSLLFQAFEARRAELRDLEGIAASIIDGELARVAQVVAERAQARLWRAIDRLLARAPDRFEDVLELAAIFKLHTRRAAHV